MPHCSRGRGISVSAVGRVRIDARRTLEGLAISSMPLGRAAARNSASHRSLGQLHALVHAVARAIPLDQRELGIVQRACSSLAEDAGHLVDRPGRRRPGAASWRTRARFAATEGLGDGGLSATTAAAGPHPVSRATAKTDRGADRRPYRPRGSAFRLRGSRGRRRTRRSCRSRLGPQPQVLPTGGGAEIVVRCDRSWRSRAGSRSMRPCNDARQTQTVDPSPCAARPSPLLLRPLQILAGAGVDLDQVADVDERRGRGTRRRSPPCRAW